MLKVQKLDRGARAHVGMVPPGGLLMVIDTINSTSSCAEAVHNIMHLQFLTNKTEKRGLIDACWVREQASQVITETLQTPDTMVGNKASISCAGLRCARAYLGRMFQELTRGGDMVHGSNTSKNNVNSPVFLRVGSRIKPRATRKPAWF